MPKSYFKLLSLALLWPLLLHAQYDPEAKIDPLGRPYRPIVGLLEPIVHPNVPKDVANYMAIAFANGTKGNAYTPYGAVNKPKLESALKLYPLLDSAERRQARWTWFYGESVGTEYLLQLEVLHFNCVITIDTPINPHPELRRNYNFYASLSARLTDVTTSKVLSANYFSVQSDSRTIKPVPGRSDSLVAQQQLYAAIKEEAPRMLNRLITGTGQITEIRQENKGKAETLIMSNSPITLAPKFEPLPVFALQETFKTPTGTFLHAKRIGTVMKTDDFNYKERNYEVRRGGKEIAESFKAGKILVVPKGETLPLRRPSPTDGRRSVLAEAFVNKTAAPDFQVRILEDVLTEYLTARPQLIDIVDREMYALIETERKLQSITQSDATQGSASVGAEYLLAANVTQLDIQREVLTKAKEEAPKPEEAKKDQAAAPKPASPPATSTTDRPGAAKNATPETPKKEPEKPPAVTKPTIRFVEMVNSGIRVNASATVDLRLVNIQTGEIVWNSAVKAGASKDYPYDLLPSTKATQDEEIVQALADNFAGYAGPIVYRNLRTPTPVLQIVDVDKDEAQTVLIGGGILAGNLDGQQFEVVEVTEEQVDGQALKREVVIAKLKADEIYPETTLCKVKKGEKELLAKFNANKTALYCRVAN